MSNEKTMWYGGNKIKEFLKTKAIQEGVSEEEIAGRIKTKLNISNRFSGILNNTYPPKLEELVPIAAELECSIDELIIKKAS